jgi:hypothetical protein
MSDLDSRLHDPKRNFTSTLHFIASSIHTIYRLILQLGRNISLFVSERCTSIYTKFEGIARHDYLILIVVLISYLILISPDLMPTIHGVLPNDEAKYIDSGRSLLDLQLRELSWGPLVAVFYATLHLVFKGSLDWFLLEAWVGRILLIAILWISTLYLANKLRNLVSRYVVVGVMFVSVGYLFVVQNQSDVLFSSFLAIALAQLISFKESGQIKEVWIGSIALGLAALSRIDTLAWILVYVLISVGVSFRTRSITHILAASLIPALSFVVGFVLLSRIHTGGFDASIGSLGPKLYQAFEQNQSVLTGGDDDVGFEQARELFGTKSENKGSIFLAILNNPSEFWKRIVTNIKGAPGLYFDAFDKRVGLAILLFSIIGVIALIRNGSFSLFTILLLWALPSAYYLGFLSRHVVSTTTYFPIILASAGITYAFRGKATQFELSMYVLSAGLLVTYSWIDNKPAFLATGVILILVLAVIWLLWLRKTSVNNRKLIAFFLLLIGAMVLREGFTFPNFRKLGSSPEEHAIQFMQKNLPSGSIVAVPTPNLAIAAVTEPFPIQDVPSFPSAESLYSWLSDKGVIAVYVHTAYIGNDSEIQTRMQEGLGGYFDLGFSEDNSIIFLVRDFDVGN